ncbi:class I SAM-dependent methyltransferase [Patescibacteria group bacterium]|nr:class I SAM-dependent methyltransferase [Patescibacteria group bacterium]
MTKEFKWGGLHPFMYHPLVFDLVPNLEDKIVVDCGCGRGIWGYLIRCTRPMGNGKMVGIDIRPDYIEFCRKFGVYDKLIKVSIVKLPFKDKSVDFLICSEVIEHLTENLGVKFLNEVERVMRPGGRAIITTPNVQMDTAIAIGVDSHSSVWRPDKFVRMGFRVRGMGVKISPGINKWYTKLILGAYYLFTPLTYFWPRFAGYLVAYRDY